MDSSSSFKKEYSSYWVILVFPFIAFWQIGLFQYAMKWDMLDQFFPYRYFISECYHSGFLPMWNPYQHLGWPFHADPQSGFWYPVTWLITRVHGYDIYAINFEFILHLCIAGIGFFALLKGLGVESRIALLFSLAYQCCGVFVNNAQHLTWIIGMAWLPFVVHHYLTMLESGKAKHAVAAGFFMMLMLTGGYPVFTIITNYFFAVVLMIHVFKLLKQKNWRLLKNAVALNAVMYLVFAFLASGYLISFYKALPYISRGTALTLEKALEGALPVKAIVSLLFPFATTKNDGWFTTDLSMLNVYFGLIPLLFALAGFYYFRIPKARLFIIFGMICLLAALGDATPVRGFLYHYLPMMDKFRFPSIFRAFFIFSFLIAGAIAFQKSLERWKEWRKYFLISTSLLALVAIGFHFYVLGKANHFIKFPSLFSVRDYLAFFEKSSLYQRIAIQSLVQFALLLIAVAVMLWIKEPSKLITAFVLITIADLFLSVQFNLPATAISEVKAADFQKRLSEMPKGFPIPALNPIVHVPTYDKRLYPSWNNQNIIIKQPTHYGFNSFYLTDYMAFYDSPARDSTLKNSLLFVEPAGENQSAQLTKFNPNEVGARLTLGSDSRVTLLQSQFPGWSVKVDGNKKELVKTAIPFLSVNVSKGEHSVEFQYSPTYVKPFVILSLLSLLAAIIYLLFAMEPFRGFIRKKQE